MIERTAVDYPKTVKPYIPDGRENFFGFTVEPFVYRETDRSVLYRSTAHDGAPYVIRIGKFLDAEQREVVKKGVARQQEAFRLSPQVVPVERSELVALPYRADGINYPAGVFTLNAMPLFPYGSLADHLDHTPVTDRSMRRNVLFTLGVALDDIKGRMVHRDVTPGNVLLDGMDRAYLTDFELAVPPGTLIDQHGRPIGTKGYMAPEHLYDPNEFSHKTDIFSGAVLALMLLGGDNLARYSDNFEYYTSAEALDAHLDQLLWRFPTHVQDPLREAMAFLPEHRQDSFLKFYNDLEEALEKPYPPIIIYQAGKK